MLLLQAELLGQATTRAGGDETAARGVAVANRGRGRGRRGLGAAALRVLRNVTVEPVLFAYMFAFMLTSVVEQTFYVDRACRVNLNFSDAVCSNIHNKTYQRELDQVQVGMPQGIIFAEPNFAIFVAIFSL